MRIVVNDIAASTGGAMSVLRDFYHCVCDNDKQNEWIFLLSDRYFEEADNVKIIVRDDIKRSKCKKILFDLLVGKKYIQSLSPDVVFSMQNIITFGIKVPQYLYLHQSIPFQADKNFSFFKVSERKLAFIQYVMGFIIKQSVKRSDIVFVQTKWMKEAVCRICKVAEDKVIQAMPGVKKISAYKCDVVFDSSSFFCPTASALYKNNDCVFQACDILRSETLDFHVSMTIPKERSVTGIMCIGRIPYEEVLYRYQESTLIFPSYIETMGLPLLEAREMGTIILASDCPFSREALEGYENAYFFNPFDSEELAHLMKRVISGEITKKEVCEPCLQSEDGWVKIMNSIRSRC